MSVVKGVEVVYSEATDTWGPGVRRTPSTGPSRLSAHAVRSQCAQHAAVVLSYVFVVSVAAFCSLWYSVPEAVAHIITVSVGINKLFLSLSPDYFL